MPRDHPDPAGFHLGIVAYFASMHLGQYGLDDAGVFWDFGSLHQKDRIPYRRRGPSLRERPCSQQPLVWKHHDHGMAMDLDHMLLCVESSVTCFICDVAGSRPGSEFLRLLFGSDNEMSQRGCGVPTVIVFSRMSSLHQLGSSWYVMNLLPLSRIRCAQTCVLSGASAGRHVLCCFFRVSVPEATILIGSRKCCDPGSLFSFLGFGVRVDHYNKFFVFSNDFGAAWTMCSRNRKGSTGRNIDGEWNPDLQKRASPALTRTRTSDDPVAPWEVPCAV